MNNQKKLDDRDAAIADLFHEQIASLIDGNHVDRKEVKQARADACSCYLTYEVDWRFVPYVETTRLYGNAAVSQHFGYNQGQFQSETSQRLKIGKAHRAIREKFIGYILNKGGQALEDACKNHEVWDFGQHSVHEECSPCGGNGSVNCSGCFGSGRQQCFSCGGSGSTRQTRWVQDYNGQGRTETYQQLCYGCGGSGSNFCNRCGGSGRQQCGECQGHGFFTQIAHTRVMAKPTINIEGESNLSRDELVKFLIGYSVERIANYLQFTCKGHRDSTEDTWRIAYEASSRVVELDIELRKKYYVVAALGDGALAFRKAPIFDDIFIEEITDLQKIFSKSKKLNHTLARKFFDTYSGQPVLDKAMKAIAQSTEKQQAAREVIYSCQGYISPTSAELLGQSVVKLLDKVSPPNSFWSWMIIMLIPLLLMFFASQAVFESGVDYRTGSLIFASLLTLLTSLIVTLLISPAAVLISSLVSYWRRRAVPREYRQRGRNWQPLKFFIKASLLVTLSGMGTGAMAKFNWIPPWQNAPLELLLNTATPYIQEFKSRHSQQPFFHPQRNYLTAPEKIKESQPKPTSKIATKPAAKVAEVKADPLLLDIQHNLIQLGYGLSVTGQLDAKTRAAIDAYASAKGLGDKTSRNILLSLCKDLKNRCSNASKTY
jgi:hypothetical protein